MCTGPRRWFAGISVFSITGGRCRKPTNISIAKSVGCYISRKGFYSFSTTLQRESTWHRFAVWYLPLHPPAHWSVGFCRVTSSYQCQRGRGYSRLESGDYLSTPHFELLPFGAERRRCPGMAFGLLMASLPTAFIGNFLMDKMHQNWTWQRRTMLLLARKGLFLPYQSPDSHLLGSHLISCFQKPPSVSSHELVLWWTSIHYHRNSTLLCWIQPKLMT